jgi:hypothetical protein
MCLQPAQTFSFLSKTECGLGLNIEAACFSDMSLEGTYQYIMDTRDLQSDPEFMRFLQAKTALQRCSNLASFLGCVVPPIYACTYIIVKVLGVIEGCMNRVILTCLAKQIRKECKERPFAQYTRHELQNRHEPNSMLKVIRRPYAKKQYVFKVVQGLCEHVSEIAKAHGSSLPSQLSMGGGKQIAVDTDTVFVAKGPAASETAV